MLRMSEIRTIEDARNKLKEIEDDDLEARTIAQKRYTRRIKALEDQTKIIGIDWVDVIF